MIGSDSGLLVLDKPAGVTSYDCVHRVKRILGVRRVGHCGTLDPLAEGVLLVLFGQATRLQESYLGLEKQYRFRAEFGRATTTGDREGTVLQTADYASVSESTLRQTLGQFTGEIQQRPHRYAALKYKGRPYYEWARKGIEIPRQARSVSVHAFDLLSFNAPWWEARVRCSRGTYIRSLVEDVATALQTVATVDRLVRERVGPFHQEGALGWEALSSCTAESLRQFAQNEDIDRHTGNL